MGTWRFRAYPESGPPYECEGTGVNASYARTNAARREGLSESKVRPISGQIDGQESRMKATAKENAKNARKRASGLFQSSSSDDDCDNYDSGGGGGISFDWKIIAGLFAIYLVIEYWWILLIAGAIALGAYFIKD